MTRPLQLLPAVDVVDGRAVRLVQGEAGTEQAYGDPAEAVASFVAAGATWIHLVDLDAAFGRGSNRELLARIVASTDAKVELSGGIRDDAGLPHASTWGRPPWRSPTGRPARSNATASAWRSAWT